MAAQIARMKMLLEQRRQLTTPTTIELSILLPNKVRFILKIWRYMLLDEFSTSTVLFDITNDT